jgi:hypothetical protein
VLIILNKKEIIVTHYILLLTNPQEKAKAIAFLLNNKSNLSTGYGLKKDNTDL